MIPTAYRRNARGLRDRQAFEVEFESPDPAAASPPGSCPRGGGHRGRPYSDLGGDYFVERQHSEAYKNRLIRQLERMRGKVTVEPLNPA